MALLDRILPEDKRYDTPASKGKIPVDVDKRLKRGREAMLKNNSARRLAFKFWRGQQYFWVDEKAVLRFQDTVTHVTGGGKPPHRVRTVRNFIHGLVEDKVSNATNRTPGYDISPSTTDPEDASAARLAQKVALYGYDKWNVRRARVKAVTNALVADGGYAMPYFDPNVGPYTRTQGEDGQEKWVGQGEVKILVLHGGQVGWEPGTDFDESPWHAIWRARPISEVEKTPGFYGKKLTADASTTEVPSDRPADEMVLVTEYFERPCPEYPQGQKLTIANHRVICPAEKYPCRDPKGQVVDEPVLHQISYTVDPDADRDMGLVQHLIDPQRTLNDCVSKMVEWKNRCLNPRMKAPVGSLKRPPDDQPGGIDWYRIIGGKEPEWERPPQVPQELFQMADQAVNQMKEIAADVDISAGSNVAARTVQEVVEKSSRRWGSFLAEMAEFDSRLMRHCLYLTARFYTEPRLLELRGRLGWESVADFRGGQLRGQCNVRVLPDSLVSRTRQATRDEIAFFVQYFPNAISPEAAMAAWHGGLAESLIEGWELDVARANQILKAIQSGPETLYSQPMQTRMEPDPVTGQMTPAEVPWWMPGPSDNVRVWKEVIGSYLKTQDYMGLPPDMKTAAMEVYNGLLTLEEQEAARQAAMQAQTAEQLGMANAAAPQTPAMPSMPTPQNGSGTPSSPAQ